MKNKHLLLTLLLLTGISCSEPNTFQLSELDMNKFKWSFIMKRGHFIPHWFFLPQTISCLTVNSTHSIIFA